MGFRPGFRFTLVFAVAMPRVMQTQKILGMGILTIMLAGAAQAATSGTTAPSAASGGASLEGSSQATEVATAAEPAVKRWKATANSYYYNFEGTREAHDNIYSFGGTTLAMQMVTLSYQISPGWTIMALGTYMDNYVETTFHLPTGDLLFKDRTLGWSDVLIDAIHPLYLSSSFLLFGDVGISVPTGSINKKNPSAFVPNGNYAYNMQMGSGTYDAELGAVGLYLNPHFQLGTHLSTYQRMGAENKNGYRLGNLYKGEGWLDVPVGYGFTPRVVGYYKVKQAIHGMDPTLGRNVYTEYYHHDQQNWDVSAALKFEHALVGTATIVAEAGKPLGQGSKNSDQVVVSTNYYGTVGVSGTF